MSDPNENRPGYKETKTGWIPKDWSTYRTCDLVVADAPIRYGVVQIGPDTEGGVPIVPIKFVKQIGKVPLHRASVEIERPYAGSRVKGGDVLLSVKGTIGEVGIVPEGFEGNIARELARLRINNNHSPEYVACQLESGQTQRRISKETVGSTRLEFSIGTLRDFHLPVPGSLSEEIVISEIIFASIAVIEKTDELINAKKRQKKALMQQLLTGKKRLPRLKSAWRELKLDDICTRLTTVADDPNGYRVLSITAGTGFVSQEDKFSRVIAGKQVENYVILKRGDFAYNKGNSYRFPQGCVYQLSEYDEGLVPNVFYSFRLDERKANPEFIKQYFLAGLHNKNLYRWINSGVRNNGLLNLNASEFFKLPINLPPLEEQYAIGEVLRTADQEIKSLNDKLAALKKQKKALMQKLMTGQVRVKI